MRHPISEPLCSGANEPNDNLMCCPPLFAIQWGRVFLWRPSSPFFSPPRFVRSLGPSSLTAPGHGAMLSGHSPFRSSAHS